MDWDMAVERNREPLLRIALALLALLAAANAAAAGMIVPRRVWRSILLVLRPAEAAARRLIVLAARALVCGPLRQRAALASPASFHGRVPGFSIAPVFQLFDPLKRFDADDEDGDPELAGASVHPALDDQPVSAAPLHQRLRALCQALADLPAQARRLARFRRLRDAAIKAGRPHRISPIRPGLPPGWRARPIHDVDPLLKECHRLARDLENSP